MRRARDAARLAAAHLPGVATDAVAALGGGLDNEAYLVGGGVVVRFVRDRKDFGHVAVEARALAIAAEVSPVTVPEPLFVVPDEGCLAYRLLPGEPLISRPAADRARHAVEVGARLGELLRALHDVPLERVSGLVPEDEATPEDGRREAAAASLDAVPAPLVDAVAAFLAAPAPPPPRDRRFSHNDLGAKHVLAEPGAWRVTGVIDWADAAVTDPAYDVGLVLRDLGREAFDAALAAYGRKEAGLRERAVFHARCAALEDLAYGVRTGRERYLENSLAALPRLFGDALA